MHNLMKNRVLVVTAVTVAVLMISVPMLAHHGTNISYDRTKMWTQKAVVTEFRYANPHPQLFFDTTDERATLNIGAPSFCQIRHSSSRMDGARNAPRKR